MGYQPRMASAISNARLKFLNTSAHYYSTLAPASSAHLMLECMTVAAENESSPSSKTGLGTICGACGTIGIPGRTSQTTIVGPKRSKRISSNKKNHLPKQIADNPLEKKVVMECLTCHRKTTTPLQPSHGHKLRQRRSASAATASANKAAEHTPLNVPTTTNAASKSGKPNPENSSSSKKRAKTRKQGGLQAMLEKSKASASSASGLGLDLMDFMKQV